MAPIESPPVTVTHRRLLRFPRREAAHTVIWLQGEQDASNAAAVAKALGRAITINDNNILVDLSEVEFMGAETVGTLSWASELLRERSRSLVLRSPPRCVRRIVELCGHTQLLDPAGTTPTTATADALGTWVPVPTADRINPRTHPSPQQNEASPQCA
jgi:anti-anti-sigma factor